MKQTKTWFYALLLLIGLATTKTSMAQTGATCATALSLTINPSESTGWQTTANDTVWYSFTAPNNICNFQFSSSLVFKNSLKDVVYGVCGDFPNGYTMNKLNDTIFYLIFPNLTISNTYKLGLVFGESGNCTTCSTDGVYKLDFVGAKEAATACTATCAGAPVCNYLCNGDFEQMSAVPSQAADFFACDWYSANTATPDHFHTSSGTGGAFPVSISNNFVGCEAVRLAGTNAYAGLLIGIGSAHNEAIVSPLAQTLTSGKKYEVSFWLSLAETSSANANSLAFGFATNSYSPPGNVSTFGSYFGNTGINTAGVSKVGWTNRTYTYTANGTETKFLIGALNGTATSTTAIASNTSCTNSYNVPVYYYYIDDISIKELLNFTVTPVPCFTVTNIAVVPSNAGTSYTWASTPATASLTAQTGYSVNVSPTGNTTYTVATTNTLGCILSNTLSTSTPTQGTINSSTVTFCPGASSVITIPGLTTYTWSAGPFITGSLNSPTITVTPTATTVYTVTGNITSCPLTYTATVTMLSLSPTFSLSSPVLCTGVVFTVSTDPANVIQTIDLDDGNQYYPNTATFTYSYAASGTYSIWAEGYNVSNGCYNNSYLPVTVSSSVTPTLSIAPSQTICAGQSATLTASGAISYTWNPGTLSGSSVVVTPTATTVYTVTGSSGCGTSTITTTVTVISNPTVTASASPTLICSGSSSTLTASGASSYTWSGCNRCFNNCLANSHNRLHRYWNKWW